MSAVDHKCPACSAPLPYDAESGIWKCKYCLSEYTLDQLKEVEKEEEEIESRNVYKRETKTMDVDEYTCPNCGAHIITDENTTATFCVYCRGTAIIKNRLEGALAPDVVIPFKTTKEQAMEAFLKVKKGKLFAPKDFGKKEHIEKITGVYIPFWLYDCNATGSIDCNATKVRSWRSGDYRYTKTDTYRVTRGGTSEFEKVPVDGSKKFSDDIMDSIEPFSYDGLKDFASDYLAGFLAEKYDIDDDEAYNRALERVKNTFKDQLKRDIIGYNTVTVNVDNINVNERDVKYALLPVWMLNIKYKDKMYMFAMNGQTGKMIGNIPVAISKAILWATGVFLGSSAIIALLNSIL